MVEARTLKPRLSVFVNDRASVDFGFGESGVGFADLSVAGFGK